jgi:tetratricopeptide (TPR) repeat protein
MLYLGERVKKAVEKKENTTQGIADHSFSECIDSTVHCVSQPSIASTNYISHSYNYIRSVYLNNSSRPIDDGFIRSLEELLEAGKYRTAISKTQELIFDHRDTRLPALSKQLAGKLCAVLGIAYYNINDPVSIKYLNSAVEILKGSDCCAYLSNAYNYLGLWKLREQKYKEMEYFIQEANSILSNMALNNCNIKLDICYNLALSYYLQHRFNEALDSINNTLRACSKYEIYCDYGRFKHLASWIYKSMGKIQEAMTSCLKAVDFYRLTEDSSMVYQCYIDLSVLYRILQDSNQSEYYINEAIRYFEDSSNALPLSNAFAEKIISMFVFNSNHLLIEDMIYATIREKYISDDVRGELLGILATIELKNKNYSKAFELYKLSEKHIAANVKSEMNVLVYQGMSEIYYYYNDSQNSNLYCSKAHTIFETKPYYQGLFDK